MSDGTETCDVLIVGGGPAGSTAAALLAERGRRVIVLEKDRHPRFHIGESLLPHNLCIFERLGLLDDIARIGVRKPGAEFASDRTGSTVAYAFDEARDRTYGHAYQVRRSEFDQLLIENARRKGADVREATRVTTIEFAPDGAVVVAHPEGAVAASAEGRTQRFAARFVLDASGRDTFLANNFRLKESDKHNSTAAVYAHFRNVERRTGDREGYITAHLAENGWFWMIPLRDGVMSVGFVGNQDAWKGRRGDLVQFFEGRIAASPTVAPRMENAERISDVIATGNYSYRCRASWGEGYALIGDAFAFLDPLFSSGVLLAMTAGEHGAAVANAWLDDPAAGRELARRTEARTRRTLDRFSWLIHRIDTPVLRGMFMSPSNRFGMREGLVAILAGQGADTWRARYPVLAFKATYYMLCFLHALGLLPPGIAEPRMKRSA